MQILFDVNFLLDMTVFLERNEDPRLESLYIDFFFCQYTIFYKNNKLWGFDQRKEKVFRFPWVVNVGKINIPGKLMEYKGHFSKVCLCRSILVPVPTFYLLCGCKTFPGERIYGSFYFSEVPVSSQISYYLQLKIIYMQKWHFEVAYSDPLQQLLSFPLPRLASCFLFFFQSIIDLFVYVFIFLSIVSFTHQIINSMKAHFSARLAYVK